VQHARGVDRDQRHLSGAGEAEPHQEERRHDDDRNRAEQRDDRIERVRHEPALGACKAGRDADRGADQSAEQHVVGGVEEMRKIAAARQADARQALAREQVAERVVEHGVR
jgi:hypothetical protein